MSAPAVKPALPTSGAQPPRVGTGAPSSGAPGNPPTSTPAAPKLPPNSTGSPIKPPGPANANHAVSSAMPLSLVQDHKAQSNALPQPPISLQRTPEKTKDLTVTSSPAPKPTSNGVEGSPTKPPVSLPLPGSDSKKVEEPTMATPIMNHSAESSSLTSAAVPLSAPVMTSSNNSTAPTTASSTQPSTPAMTNPAASAPLAAPSQQLLSKPEATLPTPTPPVSTVAAAPVSTQPKPTPPTANSTSTSSGNSASSAPISKPDVSSATATPPSTAAPAVPIATAPKLTPKQTPAPASAPPPGLISVTGEQKPTATTKDGPAQPPPQAPAKTPTKTPVPALTQTPVPTQAQAPAKTSVQTPVQTLAPTPVQTQAPAQTSAQTSASVAPSNRPSPGTASTVTTEVPSKPTPPAPPEVTKTRIEVSKPEFKVATTPRISKRKREVKPLPDAKSSSDPNDDRKSKRVRTRTQPYQSPIPDIPYMAKIKNLMKSPDDKLIVFYKNEFLAVRNQEGGFYICQAMQNIYKSSTRIRIRWLSQEKNEDKPTDVYTPDFYDVTEFDCILTNLELKKLDKNRFQLPQEEKDRTESILRRALDVEKGVAEKPSITEEHPDGLDLSLYRDEAQLKKKRASAKKAAKKAGKAEKEDGEGEEGEGEEAGEETPEEQTGESEEDVKKKKLKSKPKKEKKSKAVSKEKTKAREKEAPKKERTSERGSREATKRRGEVLSSVKSGVSKPPPEKKAKVAPTKPIRKAEKSEASTDSTLPTRSTKSRSAKAAVPPATKSSPVTRTNRERRGSSTQGRKKPGKKA